MKISAACSGGRMVARLSGELDHHEAKDVMRRLSELIDEHLPRDCVLDMSGVTFMDSSGIAVILKAERRMRECGGRLNVENPARQPLRVLDASGIDRLVPIKGGQRL